MLKALWRFAGLALSCAVVIDHANADIGFPDQCFPYCQQLDAECKGWFGSQWYYCGYNNGWVYCCGGE